MIQPMHDYVVIRPEEKKNMVGSIHLPENADELPSVIGTVLAVGPGRENDDGLILSSIKSEIGSKVVYKVRNCIPVDHAGEELLLCRDQDVIATIADDE